MTVEEKVEVLRSIFRQLSNHGIESWGAVRNGYRWKCDTQTTANNLADMIVADLKLLQLDVSTFPFRFESDETSTLIFEPIAD
ncbi:MAG: hypothetical protein JWN70_5887 [Planctomycetaceae bacterium]|nr:hypothetical protein [Planctomycetaceae bacterium]